MYDFLHPSWQEFARIEIFRSTFGYSGSSQYCSFAGFVTIAGGSNRRYGVYNINNTVLLTDKILNNYTQYQVLAKAACHVTLYLGKSSDNNIYLDKDCVANEIIIDTAKDSKWWPWNTDYMIVATA